MWGARAAPAGRCASDMRRRGFPLPPTPGPAARLRRVRARLLAALLEELGHEAGPARLVARADAGAGVAVEVLVEEHEVPPVGVRAPSLDAAVDRSLPTRAPQEDPDKPARELLRDLPERRKRVRPGGELDLERVAVVPVEPLERLDEEEVEGHPDRASPVRVAAEEPGRGLAGLVGDPFRDPVAGEPVRVIAVVRGERADAAGGEELLFVEHPRQHAPEPLAGHEGEKAPLAVGRAAGGVEVGVELGAMVDEPA